jgi:hypothetical protein
VINRIVYGVPVVIEMKEPNFVAATSALARVASSRWERWQPLSRELWTRLYEVSPALASLQPEMDGPRFRTPACLAENGERRAIYEIWALRQVASVYGKHASAREAREFYRQVAEEVDGACDRGELPSGPWRHGLVPWFHPSLRGLLLRNTWDSILEVIRSDSRGAYLDLNFDPPRYPEKRGDRIRRFLGEPSERPITPMTKWRYRTFQRLDKTYKRIVPWLAIAAGIAVGLVLGLRHRPGAFPTATFAAFLGAVLARALIIASIETYSWPGARVYLLCAYPLLIVAALLALDAGAGAIRESFLGRAWRRKLPPVARAGIRGGAAILVVAAIAFAVWKIGSGPTRPGHLGVPVRAYAGNEVAGVAVYLRDGEARGTEDENLEIRRSDGDLSATLNLVPFGGVIEELDLEVAFDGAETGAEWKAQTLARGTVLEEQVLSIPGPGYHPYRIRTVASDRVRLRLVGPAPPATAIRIRSLQLASN